MINDDKYDDRFITIDDIFDDLLVREDYAVAYLKANLKENGPQGFFEGIQRILDAHSRIQANGRLSSEALQSFCELGTTTLPYF